MTISFYINTMNYLQERAGRAAKKKAIVDFESEGNQEGVMDSLMEALKTGSAFSRDQKRNRAARPAGGEQSSVISLDQV